MRLPYLFTNIYFACSADIYIIIHLWCYGTANLSKTLLTHSLGRWRQNGSLSILRLESQNFAILIRMFLKENWLESSLNVAVNGCESELSVSSTGTTQPHLLQPSEALFRTLPHQFHRVAAWPWSNCFGIFVVCCFPFILHLKAFWNSVFFFF